ncbi:choice-of-anchor Q domain-containing protein [Patescibacteria group bacterium]
MQDNKSLRLLVVVFSGALLIGMLSFFRNQWSEPPQVLAQTCNQTVSSGQSIQSAINAASEGQTICVNAGTYHEALTINKRGVTVTGSNPSNRPVIDGDTDGSGNGYFELPGGTSGTLAGGRGYNYGALVDINNSDITFSHFIVRNSRGDGIDINSRTTPTTNVHVHNNLVQNTMVTNFIVQGEGSYWGTDAAGTVVEDNIFEYGAQYPLYCEGYCNWPDAAVFCGANDVIFRRNVVRNSHGGGILLDCNWSKSNGVLIEGNLSYDNRVSLIYIHALSNVIIRNNYFFNSPFNAASDGKNVWACLWFEGLEYESANHIAPYGIENVQAYNNLLWGCGASLGIQTQASGSYIRNVEIFNNTFVSNATAGGAYDSANFSDINIQTRHPQAEGIAENVNVHDNIFYHAYEEGQTPVVVVGSMQGVNIFNNVFSRGSPRIDSTNMLINPLLEGVSSNGSFPVFTSPPGTTDIVPTREWFRLRSGSPAIDQSDVLSSILNYDFWGGRRPTGSASDIGAHEFGSTPGEVVPPPPIFDGDPIPISGVPIFISLPPPLPDTGIKPPGWVHKARAWLAGYGMNAAPQPPFPGCGATSSQCQSAGGCCMDGATCAAEGGYVSGSRDCSVGICCTVTQSPLGAGGCGAGTVYTALGCVPVDTADAFIFFVLQRGLAIGGGITLLLLIYATYLYMTSAGDPKKLQAAKELFTAALSGLLIIIFSIFVLRIVGQEILRLPGF